MAGDKQAICAKRETEYFFHRDWTGQISLIRLDKFDFTRKSVRRGETAGASWLVSPEAAQSPLALARTARRQQAYLTKLRYEASASISSGPRWLTTIGIGDPAIE